jgi:hypothetical protein
VKNSALDAHECPASRTAAATPELVYLCRRCCKTHPATVHRHYRSSASPTNTTTSCQPAEGGGERAIRSSTAMLEPAKEAMTGRIYIYIYIYIYMNIYICIYKMERGIRNGIPDSSLSRQEFLMFFFKLSSSPLFLFNFRTNIWLRMYHFSDSDPPNRTLS